MKIKSWAKMSVLMASVAVATSVWAGGTLRYATVGEPPTLDSMVTTADLSSTIANHMFEGLYTFDSGNAPAPMLATGETVSADGKTIVIGLRSGVTFHNGDAMTSKDVVASLQRWLQHGSRGKLLSGTIESVSATGEHEITLQLNAAYGPWKSLLANINGGPVIYPAAIAAAAGKAPLAPENYIGTGPYVFNQWKANRYVELTANPNYSDAPGAANGYAGERDAVFDTLRFIPVPDVGTRVAGVKAGDYDYAESIPGDLFDDLDADASVTTQLKGGPIFGLVFMNSKHGPLQENFALRRAIQAALDKEAALRVAAGPEKLWRANGSFMPEGNFWYSESGAENFSQSDTEGARAMAAAAGYAGEPIKFMVSTNYPFHYDKAVVYTKQLAQAGFNIDLQVYDWATLIKKRAQPDQWDLFFTHHGFVPDPILISALNDNYPGWWTTAEKAALKGDFTGTADPQARKATWNQLQAAMYEQVPAMKTGDIYTYNIASPKLSGMGEKSLIWPHFWGVSK